VLSIVLEAAGPHIRDPWFGAIAEAFLASLALVFLPVLYFHVRQPLRTRQTRLHAFLLEVFLEIVDSERVVLLRRLLLLSELLHANELGDLL